MAPRLKPQIPPLFFPFVTCLPNTSALPMEDKGVKQDQPLPKAPNAKPITQHDLIVDAELTKLTC